MVKNPPANAGDRGSIPGSRRSPGAGKGNPLQYSCLGILQTEERGRRGHERAVSYRLTITIMINCLELSPIFVWIIVLSPYNFTEI